MTLVWVVGTPISQTLSVSMLSKHFSQQQKAGVAPTRGVGFWMGLVTASGSVGRIIFPLIAGVLPNPDAAAFAAAAAFLTLPLIFFPLKAYKPYMPWLHSRLACLLPAEDAAAQPHRMIRTSSNDRTEMLMLDNDADPATDGQPPTGAAAADDLLATGGSVDSVDSRDLLSSTQAMMYIVPQSAAAQGHAYAGWAREATPLVGNSGRQWSAQSPSYYTTPVNGAREVSFIK